MQNDKEVFVQTNYALFSLAPHNLADVAKQCSDVGPFDLESSLCKDSFKQKNDKDVLSGCLVALGSSSNCFRLSVGL